MVVGAWSEELPAQLSSAEGQGGLRQGGRTNDLLPHSHWVEQAMRRAQYQHREHRTMPNAPWHRRGCPAGGVGSKSEQTAAAIGIRAMKSIDQRRCRLYPLHGLPRPGYVEVRAVFCPGGVTVLRAHLELKPGIDPAGGDDLPYRSRPPALACRLAQWPPERRHTDNYGTARLYQNIDANAGRIDFRAKVRPRQMASPNRSEDQCGEPTKTKARRCDAVLHGRRWSTGGFDRRLPWACTPILPLHKTPKGTIVALQTTADRGISEQNRHLQRRTL